MLLFQCDVIIVICLNTVILFQVTNNIYLKTIIASSNYCWRCPWCNGYSRRKWTQRLEFKSWTRMIAFHIALIPLGKV